MRLDEVIHSDAIDYLKSLPDNSVNCCVTSPPYFGLRDYGVEGQIGHEPTPAEFVATMVTVFHEVRRVLRDDGTCWINIGDSYARQAGDDSTKKTDGGLKTGRTGKSSQLFKSGNNQVPDGYKQKDLMMIPARVAIALCDDGWYLRSEIVWAKPNPMPESVKDRPTKSHEMVYLLTKKAKYWYDADAIREANTLDMQQRARMGYSRGGQISGKDDSRNDKESLVGQRTIEANGRNSRSVWTIATEPTPHAHFATFPRKLITPMILAGCPPGGIVLDPFMGAGTTALVARSLGRHYIGCDLNPDYVKLANDRLNVPFTLPLPMVTVNVQLPMFQQELVDAT